MPRMRTLAATTAAVVLLGIPGGASAETATERAEAAMVAAVNEVRERNGLDALRASSSLMGSAERFSRYLMDEDSFGHASTIQASSSFAQLGEALAMHTGSRFRVRNTLGRWMASPAHRAIILTRTMRWLGTGVTRGRFGAAQATIWVLQTGRLKPLETNVGAPSLPLP